MAAPTLPQITHLRTNLTALHAQMEAESHALVPDYTRFACANPIRGVHGYFAGCADSGEHNTSLLKTPIHTRGGMGHEVLLHEHEQNKGAFIAKHGAAAYQRLHNDFAKRAQEGAKTLTAKDKSVLKTHLKTLAVEVKTLQKSGKGTSAQARKMTAEMTMLQRQLNRAGAARVSNGKTKGEEDQTPLKAVRTIPGYVHDPFKPPDPAQLVQLYGQDQLRKALHNYTVDMLKQVAQKIQDAHPGTKPTSKSSRDALLTYITETWNASQTQRLSLPDLRDRLATFARSAGNPNHGSDGKFASGGGHSAAYTPHVPADWQAAVAHAANPDGATNICATCSRMLNGPLAGQRLGFVPGNDTPAPPGHWNHGICQACAERELQQHITGMLRRQGYDEDRITRILDAIRQAGYSHSAEVIAQMSQGERSAVANLAQRLVALRLQMPQVARDYTYTDGMGNVHMVTQGAQGHWINNQIIEHGTGMGKLVIPGVTHVGQHEAGMSGGGKTAQDSAREHQVFLDALIHGSKGFGNPYSPGSSDWYAHERGLLQHAKNVLASYHEHDQMGRNHIAQQVTKYETRIRIQQREDGTLPVPHYATKMRDEQFHAAFMQAAAVHADGSNFARMRDLADYFQQHYGMQHDEFYQRMDAMREAGDHADIPYRLHYEENEELMHQAPDHMWAGESYHFVAANDLRNGIPPAYRGAPEGGVRPGVTYHPAAVPKGIEIKPSGGKRTAATQEAEPIKRLSKEEVDRIYGQEGKPVPGRDHSTFTDAEREYLRGHEESNENALHAAPDVRTLRILHGEDHLFAALAQFKHAELLRNVADLQARGYDVQPGRTKEETIQNLMRIEPQIHETMHQAQHTQVPAEWIRAANKGDRIARGDDATSRGRGEAKKSEGEKTDTISRAEHEQALTKMQAKHDAEMAQMQAKHAAELARQQARHEVELAKARGEKAATKSAKTTGPTEQELAHALGERLQPREGQSIGMQVDPYNVLADKNIAAMHQVYGSAQLPDFLYLHSRQQLATKAREMGITVTKDLAREDLARAIAAKVIEREGHIDGPPSHLDEVLAAAGATKSGGGKASKGSQSITDLVRSGYTGLRFDSFKSISPHQLKDMVGDANFHEALSRQSILSLRAMAKAYSIPGSTTKASKDDLIAAIEQWSASQPAQRASLATFARHLHALRAALADPEVTAIQAAMAREALLPNPDYTRYACANPIHGYHGYFAGCADAGSANRATVRAEIHKVGGMQAEIDLHEHELGKHVGGAGRRAYEAEHGVGSWERRRAVLDALATAAARQMTPAQRRTLTDHARRIQAEQTHLTRQIAAHYTKHPNDDHPPERIRRAHDLAIQRAAEHTMLTRHLARAQTEVAPPSAKAAKARYTSALNAFKRDVAQYGDGADHTAAMKRIDAAHQAWQATRKREGKRVNLPDLVRRLPATPATLSARLAALHRAA